MIMQKSVSNIETNINANEKKFRISASSKAFMILTDKLYSNKIRAIVRELSCNAYDSHVEAGKEQEPFIIHLPTTYEPYFEIEDFGVGISPENIENIYTVYFESNKTNSNDSDGMFGLGSKTPFAYTSQFFVTSYYKGIAYYYNNFIDKGEMKFVSLGEAKVDRCNGLSVKFSVKEKDFSSFSNEVRNILFPFTYKPLIKGDLDPNESFFDKDYVNSFGFTSKSRQYMDHAHIYAIQGNVIYKIDTSILNFKNSNVDIVRTMSNSRSVYLTFNRGSLDIAPNRENLSYNEVTIDRIHKQCDLLIKNLKEDIIEDLEKLNSSFEKSICYIDWLKKIFSWRFSENLVGTIFSSEELEKVIPMSSIEYSFLEKVISFKKERRGDKVVSVKSMQFQTLANKYLYIINTIYNKDYKDGMKFIVNDIHSNSAIDLSEERKLISNLRSYVRNKKHYENILLIGKEDFNNLKFNEYFQKVENLSQFIKSANPPRDKNKNNHKNASMLIFNSKGENQDISIDSLLSLNKKIVILRKCGDKIFYNKSSKENGDIDSIKGALIEMNVILSNLNDYMFVLGTLTDTKRIRKDKIVWMYFSSFIDEIIPILLRNTHFKSVVCYFNNHHGYNDFPILKQIAINDNFYSSITNMNTFLNEILIAFRDQYYLMEKVENDHSFTYTYFLCKSRLNNIDFNNIYDGKTIQKYLKESFFNYFYYEFLWDNRTWIHKGENDKTIEREKAANDIVSMTIDYLNKELRNQSIKEVV